MDIYEEMETFKSEHDQRDPNKQERPCPEKIDLIRKLSKYQKFRVLTILTSNDIIAEDGR